MRLRHPLLQVLLVCYYVAFQGVTDGDIPAAAQRTPPPVASVEATPPTNVDQALPAITLTQYEENGGLYASIENSFLPVMLDYLNAGGSPVDLQAALIAQPVQFEGKWNTVRLEDRTHATLVSADLDGDGLSEVVALVSIYFGAGYEGYVFVLNCVDGHYHAETIGDVIGLVNREADAPKLETISDLNHDRRLEIVVSHYADWSETHRWRVYSYDMTELDTTQIRDEGAGEVEMILVPSPVNLP